MNIISCPQIVDNFLNKEKGLTRFVSILFNQVGDGYGILSKRLKMNEIFELYLFINK